MSIGQDHRYIFYRFICVCTKHTTLISHESPLSQCSHVTVQSGRDINNATVSKLSIIEESLEILLLLMRGDPIHREGVST